MPANSDHGYLAKTESVVVGGAGTTDGYKPSADNCPSTVSIHISSEVEIPLCWPTREDCYYTCNITGKEYKVIGTDIPPSREYGEPIPFTGRECCSFQYAFQNTWPIRCKLHQKEKALWVRKNIWIKKFERHFDRAIHKHIKMITLTCDLHGDRSPEEYRAILRKEFYKMRQTKTWRKYIDGGIWFYEYTTKTFNQKNIDGDETEDNTIILNPHLHILALGKFFPQEELSNLTDAYKLGKIVDIRSDINKTLDESLAYLTHYLKKERYQVNGRNRNCFGIMMNKTDEVL